MQLALFDIPIPAMAVSPKPSQGGGAETEVVLLIGFDDHGESYLCSPDSGSLYFAHYTDVSIDNKSWLKALHGNSGEEKEPCAICGHVPGEKEGEDDDED